jgi:PAS domain S-box-containing protein
MAHALRGSPTDPLDSRQPRWDFGGHGTLQKSHEHLVALRRRVPPTTRSNGFQALPAAIENLKPALGDGGVRNHRQTMAVAVVVPAVRNGRVIYAVEGAIGADHFQRLTENFDLPAGWSMTLRDGAGQSLAHAGPEPAADAGLGGAYGLFTITSPVDRWQVVMQIPNSARHMPMLASGGALALLILAAALAGAFGSRLAGKRLVQSLASLNGGTGFGPPKIAEIQAVQSTMQEASAQAWRNDARFRRLFQDAPIGLRLTDHEGVVVAQNAAFEEMFGYTVEDAPTLEKWMALAHPDPLRRERYRERVSALLTNVSSSEALAGKRTRIQLIQVTDKQGKVHEVQAQGSFVPDGLLGSFMDVTELRKAESELRLWADAFLYAELQLVIADPHTNTILAANPAFARARGYTPDEMTGMHVSLLLPPEHREHMEAGLLERQHLTHFEYTGEHQRKDGTRFPVTVQSTVSRDESGRAISRLTYTIDLTERQRAEAEIRALQASLEQRVTERTAQLSQANLELNSFAYTVSHDLRSPLRAMDGFLHLLREESGGQLSGEAQAHLDKIGNAIVRMKNLIEGILTLTHSARHDLQLELVNLSDTVSRTLRDCANAEPDRQIHFEVQPDIIATADARMLEVVVSNLVGNAWKYTAKTASPSIRFFSEFQDGETWYCIEDNGAGFDATYADKLFQPFQRLHKSQEFPGIGIGLATVQRVILRHGGRIEAVSTPGQGATFRFTLNPTA